MQDKKRIHPKIKENLHPRNKHRERYDFKQLIESSPELSVFVLKNKYDDESIDFFNPDAVKALNKALLKHYYKIISWDIPEGYLVPPIPGRAEYIHHLADLMRANSESEIPRGDKIKCLDIGIGANCIYPIIGINEYGWSFIGSDVDPVAIDSANKILNSNPVLEGKLEIRLQNNPDNIFKGVLKIDEIIDLAICNPPFHASLAEATAGTARKLNNLRNKKTQKPLRNFGGQNNELWCEGGEARFLQNMIFESKEIESSCFWFSSLISKQSHLSAVYELLNELNAIEVKTIPLGQGNKTSRIVAWSFLKGEKRMEWRDTRWK